MSDLYIARLLFIAVEKENSMSARFKSLLRVWKKLFGDEKPVFKKLDPLQDDLLSVGFFKLHLFERKRKRRSQLVPVVYDERTKNSNLNGISIYFTALS